MMSIVAVSVAVRPLGPVTRTPTVREAGASRAAAENETV